MPMLTFLKLTAGEPVCEMPTVGVSQTLTQEASTAMTALIDKPDKCPKCKSPDIINHRPGLAEGERVIVQRCPHCLHRVGYL